MGDLVGGRFPSHGGLGDRVSVRMLGSLRVTVDGSPVDLGPPKQRSLLTVLLLHRGDVVSTDRIVDLLWGERRPRTAEHSVQLYISNLRRAFGAYGPGGIVTQKPGYLLDLPAEALDVVRFEQLADEGHHEVTELRPSAANLLTAALELWQGEPLADTALETIAQPEIRRWQDLRLRVLEDLAQACLSSGDPARAVTWAQRACREDPYRERSRELLMLALYRAGRHREALRTYTVYRESLRDELGLDPMPSLAGLQERILLHDPALDPEVPAVAVSVVHRNPYKGLRPFEVADADDYFGREALTEEILARLGEGQPLVAVVGPSGSGKSSVLKAGVLARLLASQPRRTAVVELAPDVHDPDEIESRVAAARAGDAAGPHASAGVPVLVVMDQFEEHLLALDEAQVRALLDRLANLSAQPGVSLLLALRADLYDRPLRQPGFAEIFAAGVVNVLPMTAAEVEAAVVAPASRVGVAVEPALLAELVAATADQPAQLPLLQFALTELFDRSRSALDLAGYQAIGGLQAALTRRAEQIRRGWPDEVAAAATQIFLRLVRVEGGQIVRRRTPARELGALTGVDPAAVSDVLRAVGRHHLITFDRDEQTGHATVEVAHDALFERWPWLANLLRRHRTALERHGALRVALDEWHAAEHDAGYLLRGTRLEQFQNWRAEGVLQLSGPETAFLDASQTMADDEIAREAALAESRRRLERRSRRWLIVAVAALLFAGASAAFGLLTPGGQSTPRVGWVYHRTGHIDRYLEVGLDRVADENRFALAKVDVDAESAESAAERFAAQGDDLVIVTTNDTDLAPVARRHRDVDFLMFTGVVDEPNVTSIGFAHQDGAFLAGAAAAMASKSGTVGFIGGADTDVLRRFEAGFVAGVRAVTPGARVLSTYLSRVPDYNGFFDQVGARRATRDMVRAGADVIFPAAGGAQYGALDEVAVLSTQLDRQLWGIGVDDDAYLNGDWMTRAGHREHVLTSMVIRFDVAMYDGLRSWLDGTLTPGLREYDLSNGGIELSQSGGFITPYAARLEDLRQDLASGRIDVPCVPTGLVGTTAAEAAAGPGCR